jgi:transposase InsO family protein
MISLEGYRRFFVMARSVRRRLRADGWPAWRRPRARAAAIAPGALARLKQQYQSALYFAAFVNGRDRGIHQAGCTTVAATYGIMA